MYSGQYDLNLFFALLHTEYVIRPSFIKYGIWDQIRIDHGLEWILSLYIQEMIAHWRTNTSRAPHLQTSSKLVSILYSFFARYMS